MHKDIEIVSREIAISIEELSGNELNALISDMLDSVSENDEFYYSVEEEEFNINTRGENEKLELLEAIYNEIKRDEDKKLFIDLIEEKEKDFGSKIADAFRNKKNELEGPNTSEESSSEETTEEPEEKKENKETPTPDYGSSDKEETQEENKEEKSEEETKEGPAITQYKKETEDLKVEHNKIKSVIEKYNEINEKINNMTDEQYETIKSEIEGLDENYPKELKEELVTNLENKKNGVVPPTMNEETDELKKVNIYNEELASAFQVEIYQEKLAKKQETKTKLTELLKNNDTKIQKIEFEIEQLNARLATIANDPAKMNERITIQGIITSKEKEIAEIKVNQEKINAEIAIIDSEIEELNTIIENKDNFEFTFKEVNKYLENEIEKEKTNKEKLEKEKPLIEEEINQIKITIENLTKEINALETVFNNPIVSKEEKERISELIRAKTIGIEFENNKLADKEKRLAEIDDQIAKIDENIQTIEQEISIRNEYYETALSINNLIDAKETTEEKIEEIKNKIDNSSLDDDLKADLNTKLESTIEHVKNHAKEGDTSSKKEIDKYIQKEKELDENIKTREANISLYYDALKDIKNIEQLVKAGKDPNSDEIKKLVEQVQQKIAPLPEPLKEELDKYLKNALTLSIDEVKKDPGKWQKWVAGIAGLVVGGGIVALAPGAALAVTLTAGVLKFATNKIHGYLKNKEAEKAKNEVLAENEITNIEKPNKKQKEVVEKFRKLMLNENYIKNINWFLNGAIIGSIAMGAYQKIASSTNNVEPVQENTDVVTETVTTESIPTTDYPDLKIGDSASSLDLSHGYDSANFAVNGVNTETLNQSIMYDGASTIDRICAMENGRVVAEGNLTDLLAQGYSEEQIAISVGKSGNPRAWVSLVEAVAKTVGRTR